MTKPKVLRAAVPGGTVAPVVVGAVGRETTPLVVKGAVGRETTPPVVLRAAVRGGTGAGMTPASRTQRPGRAGSRLVTILSYTVRGGRRWMS